MSVTIELKPETEKRLTEKAAQKGLKIETYIEILAEEDVNGEVSMERKEEPLNETATDERTAAFRKLLENRKDRGEPYLSDEATRRENIYEDRF